MSLLDWDHAAFLLLNAEWHSPWLDVVMPFWRSKYTWMPFYAFVLSFLVINFPRRGWLVVLMLVATVGLADAVSSHGFKKTFKRPRPCQQEVLQDQMRILVPCGKSYSFTSSHASNHMAIAVFLVLLLGRAFRRIRLPLVFWALSIGYGQIYVGAHYPLDVIGGTLIGVAVGWGMATLTQLFLRWGWKSGLETALLRA